MATINILGTGKPGTAITKDATDGTQLKVSSANGAFTTNNILLAADSNGSVKSLSSTAKSVLVTNTSGTPVYTSSLSDGQIVIGSSSGSPAAANLVAGSNITITNAANSITIAATGGGGGSGTVNSGSLGQIAYYASNGTAVSGLPTASNALLVTNATGSPSISNAVNGDITVNGITVGVGSGNINTNTILGRLAFTANSTQGFNTIVGYNSGNLFSAGSYNTVLGADALTFASSADFRYNIFVGYQSGKNFNGTGWNNIAIGSNSLQSGTNGQHNLCAGILSGSSITTGSGNLCIGPYTGTNTTVGDNLISGNANILIGYNTTVDTNSTSFAIAMGYNSVADGRTGTTVETYSPGISFGSSSYPVGFRGDNKPITGNTTSGYWRPKINGTNFYLPLFADGIATASASMVTDTTGAPILTSSYGDAQIVVGNTGSYPQPATFTSGNYTTVTYTGAGGSLSVDTIGPVIYTLQTSASTLANRNARYIVTNSASATITLPSVGLLVGDSVEIVGNGTALYIVKANTGQVIIFSNSSTTAGGQMVPNHPTDSVRVVYAGSNRWIVASFSSDAKFNTFT